ncbi:GNAT family N-acetyltransferase, partial [Bordetella bronchiseptica]
MIAGFTLRPMPSAPATPSVAVRRAQAPDAALLPAIERSAGQRFLDAPGLAWIAADEVMSEQDHRAWIAAGTSWVAECPGAGLAGFLVAERTADALHVWELAVRREMQGRGIGGRLVRAAIDAAAAAGLPAITLTTFRDLPWNQPFYARLGFATLQADGLNVRLQAILAREASLGLPAARRCAM